MKYQKSMMKIMEIILENRNKDNSIESIIKDARTGRNSSFSAINWLNKNGFIDVKQFGNQKKIIPIIDNYTLQHKYYIDSIKFKSLDPYLKTIIEIFVSELFNKSNVKMAVLFGSALTKKKYNDLDILLLGDKLNSNNLKDFQNIREKIERIFDVIINIHVGSLNLDNIFKGIIIYQSSYFNFVDQIKLQYFEFIELMLDAIKNQNDKKIFKISYNNALINLSFIYCRINSFIPKIKDDAINFFQEDNKVRNFDDLKRRGIKIGKQIFK